VKVAKCIEAVASPFCPAKRGERCFGSRRRFCVTQWTRPIQATHVARRQQYGYYLEAKRDGTLIEMSERRKPSPEFEALLDASSLGTPEAKALRAQADPKTVDEILRRIGKRDT